MTWDPSTTLDQLKERIRRRFFAGQTPMRFVDDMIYLQNYSLENWDTLSFYAKDRFGYSGEKIPKLSISADLERVQGFTDAEQKKKQAEALNKKFTVFTRMPQ